MWVNTYSFKYIYMLRYILYTQLFFKARLNTHVSFTTIANFCLL